MLVDVGNYIVSKATEIFVHAKMFLDILFVKKNIDPRLDGTSDSRIRALYESGVRATYKYYVEGIVAHYLEAQQAYCAPFKNLPPYRDYYGLTGNVVTSKGTEREFNGTLRNHISSLEPQKMTITEVMKQCVERQKHTVHYAGLVPPRIE